MVWRERKGLSEHVAVNVAYLGGKAESYTLNFSRPASGIYVQLYKFLRLGKEGARGCARCASHLCSIAPHDAMVGSLVAVRLNKCPKQCAKGTSALDGAPHGVNCPHVLYILRWRADRCA